MRFAELAVFLAPLLAVLVWRRAVARGLDGPPARHLGWMLAGLAVFGAGLGWFATRERLPPGRYVPAHVEDGRIVPGHAE